MTLTYLNYFCFINLLLTSRADDFMKRENSFIPPYTSGGWDLYGHTLITNKQAFLTNNQPSQFGAIWNTHPINFPNWEVVMQFRVHGNKGLLFGDGMALWYLHRPPTPGPVFGNRDEFIGLAIFMDTYSNHNGPHHHQHPYISAMVNNGKTKYDHDSDGTHTQLAGCTSFFRNKPHDTYMSVRYENNTLTVRMNVQDKGKWDNCFKVEKVFLPPGFFLAITAATGELTDTHEVISLKTFEIPTEKVKTEVVDQENLPYARNAETDRPHVDNDYIPKRWSDYKVIFIVILSVIGCAVLFALATFYHTRQRESRQRFY